MPAARPIAVTGATGQIGARVARALAGAGMTQRLLVRDAARAPRLAGAEVRTIGGYGAADDVFDALADVHTLFLVPAAEAPDRVEQHGSARSRARLGAPAWEVEGWISSYRAIAGGELDVRSDDVERLTGRPPTSLGQYLAAAR